MNPIRSVTVYCSSSNRIDPAFFAAGKALGAAIARRGWTLVYGGNRVGLMGAVADAARGAGGKVVGITPRLLVDQGMGDDRCDELVVTDGMRERKALLEERADALIALPGGLGTFEEFFEVLVAKLLGYHDKPIVLLNTGGYYDPLLAALEHGIAEHFIKPGSRDAYRVAATADEAVAYLSSAHAGSSPAAAPRESSAIE